MYSENCKCKAKVVNHHLLFVITEKHSSVRQTTPVYSRWLRHTKPEWSRPATSVRCYTTRSHPTWSWCWSLWLIESGNRRRTTSIWRHIRWSETKECSGLYRFDITIASFNTSTERQNCSNTKCTLWPEASRRLTATDRQNRLQEHGRCIPGRFVRMSLP